MKASYPATLETTQVPQVEPSPGLLFVIVVLACVAGALVIFLRGVALALVVLAIDVLREVHAWFAETLLRQVSRVRHRLLAKGPHL